MAVPTTNVKFDSAAFEKRIVDISKGLPKYCKKTVTNALVLIQIRAQTHHLSGGTLNYRTHRLQRSVKTVAWQSGPDSWSGRVGTAVVYGARHELGDKDWVIIRPKKSKYLTFQINGQWIRTKEVRQKLKRRPWLSNSARDEVRNIKEIFGKELKILLDTGEVIDTSWFNL